jgi:hypothetical protein
MQWRWFAVLCLAQRFGEDVKESEDIFYAVVFLFKLLEIDEIHLNMSEGFS